MQIQLKIIENTIENDTSIQCQRQISHQNDTKIQLKKNKQMLQMTNYAGSHMLCCSNVSEWLIIPHEGAEYNEKRNIMMKMNKLWI